MKLSDETLVDVNKKLKTFLSAYNMKVKQQPKYKIYIAGPWFTEKDMAIMNYVKSCAKLVNRDDIYFPIDTPSNDDPKKTFISNLEKIDDCETVFAIVSTKDVGTSFEIGYALAMNKPVIYFVYDKDDLLNKTNLMLAYGAQEIYELEYLPERMAEDKFLEPVDLSINRNWKWENIE